jgi:peptidyl-prolyl cis-trans isomerase SurA
LLISANSWSKSKGTLLDKVMAVIDDKIVTKSVVDRVSSTVKQRKLMAPMIFKKNKYSDKEILEIIIQQHLMRSNLKEVGYVINDDQVESSINSRQKQIGVDREQLIAQLNQFSISFDEYFEIIRSTIEHNVFNDKVINPLVNVTEQEVKNRFYEKNSKNRSLSFNYTLVDFSIPSLLVNKKNSKSMHLDLAKYQKSGNLPEYLREIDTNTIENVSEDGIMSAIRNALKGVQEGKFTKAINISESWHVFFIKKKDLKESDFFRQRRPFLRRELREKAAVKVRDLWFKREANSHFIKYF